MTDNNNSSPQVSGQSTSEGQIASLESDVALANRAFSASLHDASEAGLAAAARVGGAIRPVLIGVAVLGSAVLLYRLLRRTRAAHPVRVTSSQARQPLWAELARSAASTLATAAARHLAQLLLVREQQHHASTRAGRTASAELDFDAVPAHGRSDQGGAASG